MGNGKSRLYSLGAACHVLSITLGRLGTLYLALPVMAALMPPPPPPECIRCCAGKSRHVPKCSCVCTVQFQLWTGGNCRLYENESFGYTCGTNTNEMAQRENISSSGLSCISFLQDFVG